MTAESSDTREADPSATRPTGLRHQVVLVCVVMSALLYLDRVCVSIAEGYIRDDLGLGDREMAWFLGVFFWTYALGQVPSGWLSERFGPRAMLAAYILGWSACTLALGWVGGFVSLIVMRAGLGIAQAGAYPSSRVDSPPLDSVRGSGSGVEPGGLRRTGRRGPSLRC